MDVTATLRKVEGRIVAECEEYDAAGEGQTEGEALAALRGALFERAVRPQAVAPPSHSDVEIRITVVPGDPEPPSSRGPNGPGEAE